jgi:glycosyltransferase 2 family protein
LHYVTSRRFWLAVGKFAVTGAAFLIVTRYVHPAELLARLNKTSPGFLTACVALAIVQIPLVALRWRLITHLAQATDDHLPSPGRFTRIMWMSAFFNQFMPFVAGDALRVLYLRDAGTTLRTALKSTVLDRGVAAIVLLMMAPLAMLVLPGATASAAGLTWLSIAAAALLLILLAVIVTANTIARLAARCRVPHVLIETLLDLRQIGIQPAACLGVLLCSVVVHGMSCVIFGLLGQGEALGLAPANVMAVAPLILFVSFVPIAVSGWGVREGFTVVLLTKLGATPDAALLLSVSFGVAILVASLPGAVLLPFTVWRRSDSPAEQLP